MATQNSVNNTITGNAATATNVAVGGITGLGTGVATALAVNVGSAGAPVVNGGALGTPASGVATNLTSIPAANLLIASQATGDLLYASSTTVWSRLGVGSAGKHLQGGTTPSWTTETYAAPGTSGNVMTSDGINWTSVAPAAAAAAPSFQYFGGDIGGSNVLYGASFDRSTGTLYIVTSDAAGTGTTQLTRFAKDSSGQYYQTHSISMSRNVGGNSTFSVGISVIGSFVYVSHVDGTNTARLDRYASADLTGEQLMTISGTAWSSNYNSTSYTDGTDLYVSATGTTWYRYTISGTTVTNAATITQTVSNIFGAAYNGTSVYLFTDKNQSFSTGTIYKTTLTGGSSTSTTRPNVFPIYNTGSMGGIGFPGTNSTFYLVAGKIITNATSNVVAQSLMLAPIAAF